MASNPYTITVTFGTPTKHASGSTACESLDIAIQNALRTARSDHKSPLLSIKIEAGDHAPRIRNGAWVSAPTGGWPVLGDFYGRVA